MYKNGISFAKIKPKHLSADGYTLFCAARDIYLGSRHFSLSELADPAVIDRSGFCLVLNAILKEDLAVQMQKAEYFISEVEKYLHTQYNQ